jgi:hypothetical protein
MIHPKLPYLLVALASGAISSLITWVATSPSRNDRGDSGGAGKDAAVTFTPAASAEWLYRATGGLEIDDPRISFRQLSAAAERMAVEDPVAAVARGREIPGHDNREAFFGSLFRTWAEKDGATAAAWVMENSSGQEQADLFFYVADGWAEADPESASRWFVENSNGSVLDDALWEAAEAWGRKDPRGSFAWAEGLDDLVKPGVMQGLAEGWGAVDPAGAAEAGMAMGDAEYRDDFLVSIMTQWAGSSPTEASVWAVGLVNEQLRSRVLGELGEMWSLRDPAAAAAWAKGIADPGARIAAESGIAIGWSEHDPAGAAEWALETITEPGELTEMISDITFNWTNHDPRGAVAWLSTRPQNTGTDLVLKAFSSRLMDDDPGAAVAWASRISDPAERDRHQRSMLDGLIEQYGDSARSAIQNFQIPDELKLEYAARPGN